MTTRAPAVLKTKRSTRHFLTGTLWTTLFNHVIKYKQAGWKALQRPQNATTMEKKPSVVNPGENKRAEQTKTNGKIFWSNLFIGSHWDTALWSSHTIAHHSLQKYTNTNANTDANADTNTDTNTNRNTDANTDANTNAKEDKNRCLANLNRL